MTSLKKKLEKLWLSLLMTTFICIAVSRMIYWPKSDNQLQPLKISTEASASSLRSSTKSLNQLDNENDVSGTNTNRVLFFNRVPKTGSEMLVLLMQWLQGINGFRHIRLPGGKKRRLQLSEQKLLVEDVSKELRNEDIPVSFDRHVYFTNFTQFGHYAPVFLNIVRDPVDKAVSRYYYGRVTPNPLNPDIKLAWPTTAKPKSTYSFAKCLQLGDTECTFYSGQPYDLTIPYFCGHDRQCTILNDRWALARAKRNIEEYFPVVGVLEELNATLTVLENKLPIFFKGVTTMYYNELLEPHKNKNRLRPREIDAGTRTTMESQLDAEYDLYNWLKARLLQQAGGVT